MHKFKLSLAFLLVMYCFSVSAQHQATISGKVVSTDKSVVEFATVYLKGTGWGCATDERGIYHLQAPEGEYTLVVSAVGFETLETNVRLVKGERVKKTVVIRPAVTELGGVDVISSGVKRVNTSAYNVVAIDLKNLHNSTRNLASALMKVPGVKLREAGGVGSDMQLSLDGFSGKYVKVFVDGVPQEGAGTAFDLNNVPVNFAERVEVYRGVVPVGFGTDALGGVINIVTNKRRQSWHLDASYSYGSFNTHKSHVDFGQTLGNGVTYGINAFQNYSKNDYTIENTVQEFDHSDNSMKPKEEILRRVKRFNDVFHNEAVLGKVGVTGKPWADRLMFGFAYSRFYKEIQNGVYQDDVFGEKHRHGYSLVPSMEYQKRGVFTRGLDVSVAVNYNHNLTTNVDTSMYKYNWYGDRIPRRVVGEQNNQYSKQKNTNWNASLTGFYRVGNFHSFTLSHVFSSFERSSRSLIKTNATLEKYGVPNETRKHITGLSYRVVPSEKWNMTVFGKYYQSSSRGAVSIGDNNVGSDTVVSREVNSWGYGGAGTGYFLKDFQAKLSYEKALRLPSTVELFGDGDLEAGQSGLKPERSDNFNINISYSRQFNKHGLYAEGSLIYRDTRDYIKRGISTVGGTSYGTYENHGRVETKGFNISARYSYSHWFNAGGTFNKLDARDKERKRAGGTGQNALTYDQRIPNQPYMYGNFDVNFDWRGLFARGNTLSVTWDCFYQHDFPLHWEGLGDTSTKIVVPEQVSHNVSLTYGIRDGRYNISFECRNLTDTKLYDNFSLQKAGRAFYGKVRVYFGR